MAKIDDDDYLYGEDGPTKRKPGRPKKRGPKKKRKTKAKSGRGPGRPRKEESLKVRDKKDKKIAALKPDKRKLKRHKTGSKEAAEQDEAVAGKNESLFRRRLKKLRKTAGTDDYSEQTMLKLYKSLLDMVLDLIPIAEINYRNYKVDRSAYALNTYINQSRQIAADMRTIRDFTEQAQHIVSMVRQQFTLIVQNMVDECYRLKKETADSITNTKKRRLFETRVDRMLNSHGKYLNESSKQLASMIQAFMTETPATKEAVAVRNG